MALQTLDWLAIGAYFAVLLSVAWWVVRKGKDEAADYFLAGRNLSWWIIGASIFASNIGSEHIVGLAGSGAKDGVAMAHYEFHAWCLLVLAWVFVPFYARSLVFTMPEFLERRFSVRSRYVLSIVSIITFILAKIAVGIFAGGVVFATLLPEMQITIAGHIVDAFWIGSVFVIALTGLYTAIGGMRAVVYNDAVQVTVLIGGSALLTFYGLNKLGGWNELRTLCGSDMFNLWKPLTPAGVVSTWSPVIEKNAAGDLVKQAWYFNGAFPWLGMAICAPVIGLWYWCTDQYTAIPVEPGDASFDDPALGQQHELADVRTLDDFHVDLAADSGQPFLELRSLVAGVGIEFQQERMHAEQRAQQQHTAVTVLRVRRMNDGVQQTWLFNAMRRRLV